MSYRRRQATLARAIAGAQPRNLNPKGWGENIEVGCRVTTFGRHGAGQPAIDGEVTEMDDHAVRIKVDEHTSRVRSIGNVRRVG